VQGDETGTEALLTPVVLRAKRQQARMLVSRERSRKDTGKPLHSRNDLLLCSGV
jgi:hypothetical protein